MVIESLRQAIIAANEKINEAKKEEAANEQMACVLTCMVADKKNQYLLVCSRRRYKNLPA